MLRITPERQGFDLPTVEQPTARPEIAKKVYALLAVFAILFLVLAGRLLYLQVFQFRWFNDLADQNYLRLAPVMAPRGLIYDSTGHLLVGNTPVYSVSILYTAIKDENQLASRLGPILGMAPDQITALIDKHQQANDIYLPIRLATNVDQAVVNQIAENQINLPGVILDTVPQRYYPYNDLAGQVFGYVGDINQAELDAHQSEGYTLNDQYGQAGLENTYQQYLHGTDGALEMEVNAQGTVVGQKGQKDPTPGDNLTLTLSAQITQVGQQALATQIANAQKLGLGAQGGAVVLEDVHTGKILAMASYPSFNPAVLSPNPPPGENTNIFQDSAHPFLNRALMAYPPGSTFKPVVATAGLVTGAITPQTELYDPGYFMLGSHRFNNWYHPGFGDQNVTQAIQDSNDVFFYQLGLKLGWQPIAQWAQAYGLGQPTGIDLPAEETGVVPTAAYKTKLEQSYVNQLLQQKESTLLAQYNGDKNSPDYQKALAKLQKDTQAAYAWDMQWQQYDSVITAIGQGYNLYTPLQLADYTATIANGGTLYKPYLVDKVIAPDGGLVLQNQPTVVRQLNIPPSVLDVIHQGMGLVTQDQGTAAAVFAGFPVPVAGKTGTAQNSGTDDSLFIAYAPANNPQVAAVAVVEHGGEGNAAAAPVVKAVLSAYFNVPTAGTTTQPTPTSGGSPTPATGTTTPAQPPATPSTTAPTQTTAPQNPASGTGQQPAAGNNQQPAATTPAQGTGKPPAAQTTAPVGKPPEPPPAPAAKPQ
ncbi:MAG TPA: penicillin-binding protein 2 [Spirochaetia bacterium]|nr:penicillin-binding protein 2 [Spirochaetia bacterium]